MSTPSDINTSQGGSILGMFAGVVGLFASALFFTGWIYRWAYFSYFQLDVTTLNFAFHSYLIVPIQVFLGSPSSIALTAFFLFFLVVAIYLTLWLLNSLEFSAENRLKEKESHSAHDYYVKYSRKFTNRPPLFANLERWLTKRKPLNLSSFRSIEKLINDVVIVGWILIFLFFYAHWRGNTDAQRDAYHCTSKLPAIAFVMPVKNNPIARNFQSLNTIPQLPALDTVSEQDKDGSGEFGIIGDVDLFDSVRQEIINAPNQPTGSRVWRFLLETNGWMYLFPAIPLNPKTDPGLHPPLLAIRMSFGDQLMILRPEVAEEVCGK